MVARFWVTWPWAVGYVEEARTWMVSRALGGFVLYIVCLLWGYFSVAGDRRGVNPPPRDYIQKIVEVAQCPRQLFHSMCVVRGV